MDEEFGQFVAARGRALCRTAYLLPPDQPARSEIDKLADRYGLWGALSELSPHQRAVLVLRYFEDLTEAQIAAVLGCSAGSVKTHAARGLDRLRTMMTVPQEEWR